MKLGKLLLFAAAIVALPVVAFADSKVKAGQWQITTKTEMTGSPVQIPPVTTTVCITKEEAEKPESIVPKQRGNCKMVDYKIDGNKATWTMECTTQRGGTMTGTGEVTYSSDSYDGKMHMTMKGSPHGDMTIDSTFSGKHISDTCSK